MNTALKLLEEESKETIHYNLEYIARNSQKDVVAEALKPEGTSLSQTVDFLYSAQENYDTGKVKNIANFVNNNYLDDKVYLLGSKTHQELLNYFKASYLHILLSTNESFGKTIIESGLAGVATLASGTLGASFIIQDAKNGWLVEINDLKGTIERLEQLLDRPEVVGQVSLQAKKDYIEHYSQDKTFTKINNFWQEIVNKNL